MVIVVVVMVNGHGPGRLWFYAFYGYGDGDGDGANDESASFKTDDHMQSPLQKKPLVSVLQLLAKNLELQFWHDRNSSKTGTAGLAAATTTGGEESKLLRQPVLTLLIGDLHTGFWRLSSVILRALLVLRLRVPSCVVFAGLMLNVCLAIVMGGLEP
jgi:hypothetical protein